MKSQKENQRLHSFAQLSSFVLGLFLVLSMTVSFIVYKVIFLRARQPNTVFDLSPQILEEEGIEHRSVSFYSEKNQLYADIYGKEYARGLVIVVNGVNSCADTHLAEARYFAEAGWYVMTFDGTGTRRSDGEGIRGLTQYRIDLLAALAYAEIDPILREQPVFLYGHSAGAWASATAIEETKVRGAVCIDGFDSPMAMMKAEAKKRMGFLSDFSYPFLLLTNYIEFGKNANIRASKVLERTEKPVMVVTSEGDQTVTKEITICSFLQKKDNVQLYEMRKTTGDPHNNTWLSPEASRYRISADETEEVDSERANELDSKFMEDVSQFFLGCLEADGGKNTKTQNTDIRLNSFLSGVIFLPT